MNSKDTIGQTKLSILSQLLLNLIPYHPNHLPKPKLPADIVLASVWKSEVLRDVIYMIDPVA